MPDDVLQIGASFDVSPITSGMNQAAGAVSAGASRMAESFQKSGMSANEVASALKNMGYSADEVTAAMGATAPAIDQVSQAADRSTRSFTNARIAGQGFMQEIGVRGPRVLTAFLAQSSTIGPILQAAFPVVAAIAFFEVLSLGYDKLISVTSAMGGWDEAAKKMYDTMLKLNEQTVAFNYNLEVEKLALNLAGLKGSALDRQKEANLTAEQTIRSKELTEALHREQSIRTEMAGNPHDVTVNNPETGLDETFTETDKPGKDRMKQLQEELQENIKLQNELQEGLRKLNEVQKPQAAAETKGKEAEEAKKELENWARVQDELGKEQEEAAVKRGNAEREAAEQAERFSEEEGKHSMEGAQADLAEFEKMLERKQKLAEEYGTREVQDIGAESERKQKQISTGSAMGGGDPRLIDVATEAYNKQIAILDELVQKEHELQAVSKDSNNPADREAYLASLQRENGLIGQMDTSYRKLQSTMQSVADNQQRSFQKALTTISGDFNHSFIQWMNGSETFGRAMQHVWTGVADTVISSLLKTGEQMIANAALGVAIDDETKLSKAGVAAASTYATVSGIPIIGPFLAPEAAAVAFAAVLAFEKGGLVPSTQMAMLHKNEMVLPAHISQSVQKMADSGNAGGGGHTFNYSPSVHGSSSAGIKDMLDQHGKEFVNYALREMRRKNY
jgi:hypothetical protein